MDTSLIMYRLFDVADEIDLDQVQAVWLSRNLIASRLRLSRASAQSLTFKNPPVLVELGMHELELAGMTYPVEVKARIQELGVICLIFNVALPEELTYAQLHQLSMATDALDEQMVRGYLDAVLETIAPACTKQRVSEFEEDFVVYYFRDPIPADWDLAPILMKDDEPLSVQTRTGAMDPANVFSYSDDICYLAWDSAIVHDPSGIMDVPDLLEFANAQFLEERYYDNVLDAAIEKAYDDVNAASVGLDPARFAASRSQLLETMSDVSKLTGNITNALQVTEDVFYARVYARYMELLKARDWQQNIAFKLRVLGRCYNLLAQEDARSRAERLAERRNLLLALLVVLGVVALLMQLVGK